MATKLFMVPTVTVTNPQTNFRRTTTTSDTGNYSFPGVLPAVYNVRAEIAGLQRGARNSVELQVQPKHQPADASFISSLIEGAICT
jgi:hypothetical protein